MPVICEFYGIKIMMFWSEHVPPHFHAEFGEYKVMVDIEHGTVIKGMFPSKQLKLVLAWCEIHRNELLVNWSLSNAHKAINKIAPLI